jgi:hypothetical protein
VERAAGEEDHIIERAGSGARTGGGGPGACGDLREALLRGYAARTSIRGHIGFERASAYRRRRARTPRAGS